MAPAPIVELLRPFVTKRMLPQPKEVNHHQRSNESLDEVILEAWSQGFLVGGLIVLIMITVANMRRGVLLHKLILIELIMALGHGTFIFTPDPVYGWHLSATAIFLYLSWYLHNIVAWMKNKPFLPRWGSWLYIGTVVLVFPYWVCEMYYNFAYFNALGNDGFRRTRPFEALARDPWWIFTTIDLIYIIKREYKFGLIELIRASPRFGVLIFSMFLSIVFLITDVIVTAAHIGGPSGINPYWKLALVFKCAADALFLDDFKKVLDVLITHTLSKVGGPNGHLSMMGPSQMQEVGVGPQTGSPQLPEDSGIESKDFGLHPIVTSESLGSIVPATRTRSFDQSQRSQSPATDDDLKGSRRHANMFIMPGFNRRRRSSDESFGDWDDPVEEFPVPATSTTIVPLPLAAVIPPPLRPSVPSPEHDHSWQQAYHRKQGHAPFRTPPNSSGRHSAVEAYDFTRGPRPPGPVSPARSEPGMGHTPPDEESIPRSEPHFDPSSVPDEDRSTPPPVPSRSPARSVRTPDGSTHSGAGGGLSGSSLLIRPPPRTSSAAQGSFATVDGSFHSGIETIEEP